MWLPVFSRLNFGSLSKPLPSTNGMQNMTPSTPNSGNQPQATPAKKTKAKGPIRFEAVVPILIVIALIYIYFALFFDMHLRHALEFVGTHGNGAEVDIGHVH